MHLDHYLPADKRGDGEQESRLLIAHLVFPRVADDSTELVKFSGEEGYGRFLDLHELHTVYINLKGMPVCIVLTMLCEHICHLCTENRLP